MMEVLSEPIMDNKIGAYNVMCMVSVILLYIILKLLLIMKI